MTEAACYCPQTAPDWAGQDVDLSAALVHDLPIKVLFNMPVAYDMYHQRQYQELHRLELPERWPGLVLTRMGMFSGRLIRLLQDHQTPCRHVHRLAPDFHLRGLMHDGDIGTVRESFLDLQTELFNLGRLPKELYMAYLTCPVCRDRKGGDRILLLRRWVDSPRLRAKQEARRRQS